MENGSTSASTGTSSSMIKHFSSSISLTEPSLPSLGTTSTMHRSNTTNKKSKDMPASATSARTETGETEIPRWFPRCCGTPILYGKPEALGWMLGNIGQFAALLGIGTFVVPALLHYATLQAGCPVEPPPGETEIPDCNGTVYGIKPSSLITTLASFLSLAIALMTPIIGAIIDYTHHRRRIGRILATLYCCVIVPFIFISESTWFPLSICLLSLACIAISLTLVLHAYLPELTDDENELNHLTKIFTIAPGSVVIVFIIAVIGISVGVGVGGEEGPTAQIAAILGLLLCGTCFLLTWGFLLKERPATNTRREGQSLLTEGFKQIYRTTKKLYHTNTALLWFYAAVALGDVKPLTTVALTFLSSQQQFSSTDVGVAAITMLVATIPGALLSSWACRKLNPVRSSVLALICMMIITFCASAFLTGPNQKPQTYAVVACWGIMGGWKVASTYMLVAAILPEGQDAELMGFYLFADTSLSWCPPLIFTAMNEAGMSERAGLASITVFFFLGLVAYWKMGRYEDCVKAANRLVQVDPEVDLVAVDEDQDDPPLVTVPTEGTNHSETPDHHDETRETPSP